MLHGGVVPGTGWRRKGLSGSPEQEGGLTHTSVSLRSDPSPGGQHSPPTSCLWPGRGEGGRAMTDQRTWSKSVTAASSSSSDAVPLPLSQESCASGLPFPSCLGAIGCVFCGGSFGTPKVSK